MRKNNMWESPIELQFGINDMVSEFIKGQTEQTEKYIVESVQSVGININKDELIKAINYDRNQYEKGYQDGLNANKWIPVSERLPEESLNSVIGWDVYRERCVFVQYIDGYFQIMGSDEIFDIVAWMPLPQPYKVESEDKV